MSQQRKIWGFRVKGGSGKDQFSRALELNRVLYGWSDIPLDQWAKEGKEVVTYEELKKRLLPLWEGHFRDHPRSLSAAASMLWNYLFVMKKGDIVIVPTYRQFAIGEFTDEIGRELDEFLQEEDIANWRGVNWLTGLINRSELTAAFQSSLKNRRAIFYLDRYSDEIDELLNRVKKEPSLDLIRDYEISTAKRRDSMIDVVQRQLASRHTHITSSDFERLVAELICLESQGFFNATTTSNHEESLHGADVMVESTSESLDIKLKIQVRLYDGVTGESAIKQILKRDDPFNTLPMVVTSGEFSREVMDIAEENEVLLVNGMQVAEMICTNLDHLSDDLRAKLGLVNLPTFLEE